MRQGIHVSCLHGDRNSTRTAPTQSHTRCKIHACFPLPGTENDRLSWREFQGQRAISGGRRERRLLVVYAASQEEKVGEKSVRPWSAGTKQQPEYGYTVQRPIRSVLP